MARVPNRRPALRIVAPAASPEEAAAVVAALERFMRETAPHPRAHAAAGGRLAARSTPGGRRARAARRALALAGAGEALRRDRDAVGPGRRPGLGRRGRREQRQRAPTGARGRDRVDGEGGALSAGEAGNIAAHAPAVAERARRRGHEQARRGAVAEAYPPRRRRGPCRARRRGRPRARRRGPPRARSRRRRCWPGALRRGR